jgi:hypothetical protein
MFITYENDGGSKYEQTRKSFLTVSTAAGWGGCGAKGLLRVKGREVELCVRCIYSWRVSIPLELHHTRY